MALLVLLVPKATKVIKEILVPMVLLALPDHLVLKALLVLLVL